MEAARSLPLVQDVGKHEPTPAGTGAPTTRIVQRESDLKEGELRSAWGRLIAASDNLDATFQTPSWLDHARKGRSAALIEHRDRDGTVDGVVPVLLDEEPLEFNAGRYLTRTVALRSAIVLGGEPLLAPDRGSFEDVLSAIDAWAPHADAISFPLVRTSSLAWKHLHASPLVRDRFRIYAPVEAGAGAVHSATLPSTFQDYVAALPAKRRSNFRRKINVLSRAGTPASLRRFDQAADVGEFLTLARAIAAKSWQAAEGIGTFAADVDWYEKLVDLARRDIFRGFILYCGDAPCAFGLGYEAAGTFHFRKTAYDGDHAADSPGTVLMYMVFENLLAASSVAPKHLCFCYGDAPYKRFFTDTTVETERVLLLRRTVKNELVRAAHMAFRVGVEAGKFAQVALRSRYGGPGGRAAGGYHADEA